MASMERKVLSVTAFKVMLFHKFSSGMYESARKFKKKCFYEHIESGLDTQILYLLAQTAPLRQS